MIQRCLLHLRMEIDHRQRAILHRIAGAKFHPILEGTGKHRAIEGAMKWLKDSAVRNETQPLALRIVVATQNHAALARVGS